MSQCTSARGESGSGARRRTGAIARRLLVSCVLAAPAHVLVPGPVHAAGIAPSEAGANVPKPDVDTAERGTGEVAAGPNRASPNRAGAERRPPSGSGVEIRKRIRAEHVAASLRRAYSALLAGEAESAAETYRQVLGNESGNRDAHLGLAALAARAGRWDEAAGFYARVLAQHPADPVAQTALVALGESDAQRGESRLKALLLREPRAAYVHFALGNLYAAQSRWPEARLSYFNARRFDRANPDYTYNLAVSLDHLVERSSALDLYHEALDLAKRRFASFETAAVLARIRAMEAAPDAGESPAHAPAHAPSQTPAHAPSQTPAQTPVQTPSQSGAGRPAGTVR